MHPRFTMYDFRNRYNDLKSRTDDIARAYKIASLLCSAYTELFHSKTDNIAGYYYFIQEIIAENKEMVARLYEEVKSLRSRNSCRSVLGSLLGIAFQLAARWNNFSLLQLYSNEILSNIEPLLSHYIIEYRFENLRHFYYQANPNSNTPFVESAIFKLLEKHHPKVIRENLQDDTRDQYYLPRNNNEHTDFAKYLQYAPHPWFYLYVAPTQQEAAIRQKKLADLDRESWGTRSKTKVTAVTPLCYQFLNEHALILLKTLAEYCVTKSSEFKIRYAFFGGGKKVTYQNKTVKLPDTMTNMVNAYKKARENPTLASSCLAQIMLLTAKATLNCANANPQRDHNVHFIYANIANGSFWVRNNMNQGVLEDVEKAVKCRDAEIRRTLNQYVPDVSAKMILDYMQETDKPLKLGTVSWDNNPEQSASIASQKC